MMTYATSDALAGRFGRSAHSRIALALSHAISDSQIRPQVVPFGSKEIRGTASEDYFTRLLQEKGCDAAWKAYTNATEPAGFPQQLAQGTVPLNGFRHYTLDAIYLEYYVRVRMGAIGAAEPPVPLDDLKTFVAKIPNGLAYSENTRSTCEYQLGIPKGDIDDEWKNRKSAALMKSVKHYEKVIADAIRTGNSWLDIYFALLPCIKGYYEIAKALLQDKTTNRNTLYYSSWIVVNADSSYADRYDKFIKDNIGPDPTPAQWAKWGQIFKESCENEKNFFNLALNGYPKYNVMSGKKYKISPYINDATFLAYYNNQVTLVAQSVPWELINSEKGYSLKLGENQFLGVDDQQKVIIRNDGSTTWSINPVFIPGKNTYELFPSGVKQALDANGNKVSVVDIIGNTITQTWILSEQ